MIKIALIGVSLVVVTAILFPFFLAQVEQDLPQQYFFFQDADFSKSNNIIRYWRPHTYHHLPTNQTSFTKFTNQTAHGFYNVSGDVWVGAVFLQGDLPHKINSWGSILGGSSKKSADKVDGVNFFRSNPIPEETYFLNAKVKILQRNYTSGCAPDGYSWAHVVPQFSFAFDDSNYDDADTDHKVCVYVEVALSSVVWDNETRTLAHRTPGPYFFTTPWDNDYHIFFGEGKMEELDKWCSFKIDMGKIINKIFDMIPNITKLTFKSVLLGCDGCASYLEVMYDDFEMTLEQN